MAYIGVWCNGSIPVSKTVGESSNLSTPAMKRIVYNENGTIDKFLVSERTKDLILAMDKNHEWIKKQTLSEELVLNVYIPEDDVTITFSW